MHRRLELLVASAGFVLLCVSGIAAMSDASDSSARPLWVADTDRAPSVTVTADLDGDREQELVALNRGRGGILIRDGDQGYRSRPRWRVAAATLGDVDRNGLPEVVALLDAEDGRHLALIGWHAGVYHERLVSSALPNRPLALEAHDDPRLGGWVVVLTEKASIEARRDDPDAPSPTTTYRWNGFGFIAIAGEGAAR